MVVFHLPPETPTIGIWHSIRTLCCGSTQRNASLGRCASTWPSVSGCLAPVAAAHPGPGGDCRQPDHGSGFLGSELKRPLCLLTLGLFQDLEGNGCKASAFTHQEVLKVGKKKNTEPYGSSGKVQKQKPVSDGWSGLTRTC